MAEPQLQVEERLDRQERAIRALASLVQAQTDSNVNEAIDKILKGDFDASQEPSAEAMGVRQQGESLGHEAPLQQQGTPPGESREEG